MVDAKLTALTATTSSTGDDLIYIVDDPSGTPASYKITKDNFFKFTDGGVIYDANGNEILKVLKTTSAVNEVEFQNAATGNPAVIRASGETNIGILLTGKGTGKIQIGDAADPTKKVTFELVGATTAKTMTFTSSHTDDRIITFPDATDTLVGKATTDTLTNKTLTAPKFADLGYIADPAGNELIILDQTASAVNEITVVNSATTVMPIIKASGETNIGLQLSPKGTGKVSITDGTDLTKKTDFNVSGVTTGNTRVLTIPDSDGIISLTDVVQTFTGAKTFGTAGGAVSKLIVSGATSGSTIIDATAIAGSGTVTLPTTGTLATLAGAETLSSKTLTAPILGTPISGVLTNCTGLPLAGLTTAAKTESIIIACSDNTTALTTGIKVTFYMPYAFTLTDIRASVLTAPTGAGLIVDVYDSGSTVMNTDKLDIDVSEFHTKDCATQPAITDPTLANNAKIEIKIDQVGSTIAGAGLTVYLIGYQT